MKAYPEFKLSTTPWNVSWT